MDEMSALSQEIQFHEKFRGYDPDEVDAYVDRVRNSAALAAGRISELHERIDASESLVESYRANSAEETVGRTLILAQQTADRVIAEAETQSAHLTSEATEQAAATVSAANEQSSRILAEAETDRREMIRNAEADSKAAAEEGLDRLRDEVANLTAVREFLEDDIAILEKHVREQRSNLSDVVTSLTQLMEQPESLRLEPAPATSGVTPAMPDAVEAIDDLLPEAEVVEEVPSEAEMVDELPSEPEVIEETLHEPEVIEETLHEAEIIDLSNEQFDEVEVDEPDVDLVPTSPEPPRLMTAADMDDQSGGTTSIHEPDSPVLHQEPAFAVPLFADMVSSDGPDRITHQVAGLTDDEMLADDDALSAFFDQDDEPDRPWFGRKG